MSEFYTMLDGKTSKEKEEIIQSVEKAQRQIDVDSKKYVESYGLTILMYKKK